MTLEEKAAQLGSLWLKESVSGGDVAPMEHALSQARGPVEESVRHGMGHLTRVFGSKPIAVEAGVAALAELQRMVRSASRFGIGALAHEECLTGFTTLGATVYPGPLAWAATFDPELMAEMGRRIGADMRAVGVHQGLAPVLDVVRDHRWGRVEETLGEDPYLVGVMGTAYVRGLQDAGAVATLKHFAGYAASTGARNHAPVSMGPRELADTVLPPFEMAVREGGVGSVMNSYTDVDGVPVAANPALLTRLLREEWGFEGTVVSDYWSVVFLQTLHGVAEDPAGAARLALTAGMDVELPRTSTYAHLPELVRSGEVPQDVLDTAVRRVLAQKERLGLLGPDGVDPDDATVASAPAPVDLDSAANRDVARRLAERSVVLLTNARGLLPWDRGTRVAVVGPVATEARSQLGCYSFPNHVLSRFDDQGTGIDVPTLLDALRREHGDVDHAPGCAFTGEDRSRIPDAVQVARDADVALVAVGDLPGMFGRGTSGEGCDVEDLRLPGVQHDLVEAVLDTGVPVVLLVVSGRPYALGDYVDRCAAVLQAFLPGAEGAAAVAGVLTGRVAPSGRLPLGIPRSPGTSPSPYRSAPLAQASEGISNLDPSPLFPFGHGLGYSTVAYESIEVSSAELAADGEVEVTVTVRNTGDRDTDEVVQLYLSDPVARVVRPVRELVGFARVPLAAGQSCRVAFTLHADRASYPDAELRRVVEPGLVRLAAGPSSGDLPLTAEVRVVGPEREIRGPRVMTTPWRTDRRTDPPVPTEDHTENDRGARP